MFLDVEKSLIFDFVKIEKLYPKSKLENIYI